MEPRYNEGLRLTYTVRGSLYRDSTVSGIDPKNVCVIRAQYVMLFFISSVLDRL